MTCHDVIPLLNLHAAGGLPPEEGAAIEAHLAACVSCRDALEEAAGLSGRIGALAVQAAGLEAPAAMGQPSHRRPWRWAAAAGLLAVAGVALWMAANGPATPAFPEGSPAGGGAVGTRALGLEGGGRVACVPGTLLEEAEGGALRLKEGACWIRTGGPLLLETPASRLRVQGCMAVRVPRKARSAGIGSLFFLSEAVAAESGRLEVFLLEGARAEIASGDTFEGPIRLCVGPGTCPEGVAASPLDAEALAEAFSIRDAAEGEGAWQEVPALEWREAGGGLRTLLVPLPGQVKAVAVEAEIRVPQGCQVALCYPSGPSGPCGGRTMAITLGSGTLPPGEWSIIRFMARGGRLELFAGPRLLVSGEGATEALLATPSVGLEAWGRAEVRSLRWRALSDGSEKESP